MGKLLLTSCGFYTISIRDKFKEQLNDNPSILSVGINLTIEERLLKYEEEFQQKVLRIADNEAVFIDKIKKFWVSSETFSYANFNAI